MFRITANYWKLEDFMKTLRGGIRRRWYTSDKRLPANKSDYYSYTAKSYEWRLNLWLILQEIKTFDLKIQRRTKNWFDEASDGVRKIYYGRE